MDLTCCGRFEDFLRLDRVAFDANNLKFSDKDMPAYLIRASTLELVQCRVCCVKIIHVQLIIKSSWSTADP